MVKTALKLLLVFVEFTESNAQLLIQAVETVEQVRGEQRAELLTRQVAESSRAWCFLVSPWKGPPLVSSSKPFLVASKDCEMQAISLWGEKEGLAHLLEPKTFCLKWR